MSSTYGEYLKLSVFGQSHGPAIGMILDSIPAGMPVDMEKLQAFLDRRAPGNNPWSTPRKEADRPEFLGGILDGYTCGAPISAVIYNQNTHSADYANLKDRPRPGHSDYTADIKYGGFQDANGGGHFSGRLTAPLCIAGGLCKQWLENAGIHIAAHILSIGSEEDKAFDPCVPEIHAIGTDFPTLSNSAAERMINQIKQAHEDGDSIGGRIECAVTGLPAGIGEPMFGGVESRIATILYSIPAVKAVSFGDGEGISKLKGSEANDNFTISDGNITFNTNHCGGILGGISNGMPLLFTATFKPTPSISKPQQTVDLKTGRIVALQVSGRHDPCIVPRAVPVVEAAAAIAIYDMILGNTQTYRRK